MDLSSLAQLRSAEGPIVTLYVNRPAGAASATLTDLLKPVRAAADDLPRKAAKAVTVECDRIHDLAPRLDGSPAAAHAIVAVPGGPFVHEVLAHAVWDVAQAGPRPYLRPLRALPPAIRTGIVVADRRRARTYLATDTTVEPAGTVLEADLGKSNFGGFSGYEEHGVRRRAEHETTRMLKQTAARMLDLHKEDPFDALLLGGHQETLDELIPYLHSYLQELPVGRAVVDPHTLTLPELRERAEGLASAVRSERDHAAATDIDEAVGRGTGAAGTAAVLEAANGRAIDRLAVAGRFEKPGVVCAECGWMARTGEGCPVCGGETSAVDDIVGYLIESVLEAGGKVHHLTVAGPIDRHGVAASLRFPI